jgi:hypothetical protein
MAETDQQWIPPKLIVKALINPQSWAIYTAEQDREYVCALGPSQTAKRYAHLFAAAPELYEAVREALRMVKNCPGNWEIGVAEILQRSLKKAKGENPNG